MKLLGIFGTKHGRETKPIPGDRRNRNPDGSAASVSVGQHVVVLALALVDGRDGGVVGSLAAGGPQLRQPPAVDLVRVGIFRRVTRRLWNVGHAFQRAWKKIYLKGFELLWFR